MGFWNIQAKDLRVGDEIRLTVMGGEEFVTVQKVERDDGEVKVSWKWSLHIPDDESVEDRLPFDEKLTVRR